MIKTILTIILSVTFFGILLGILISYNIEQLYTANIPAFYEGLENCFFKKVVDFKFHTFL